MCRGAPKPQPLRLQIYNGMPAYRYPTVHFCRYTNSSVPPPQSVTETSTRRTKYANTAMEENERGEREESFERQPFLNRQGYAQKGRMTGQPFFVAIAAGLSCLTVFVLGFLLGRSESHSISVISTSFAKELAESVKTGPAEVSSTFPGVGAFESSSIFDVLRSLPPVDLYQEYGLQHNELSLYPQPLREQICIVNTDTRKWSPEEHRNLKGMDVLHWGYLNHYLYAQMHGYTFKHVQAPEQSGLHNTWVKIKEQYRMTMREECKFVIMLDGDTIFEDIRVPLEALLSHWNITEDIAVAGGIDIDKSLDIYGRVQLNTGFVITQRTPIFNKLMQDWIDCPTDVKWHNCSQWKETWSHEQAALSNYVRYDPEYKNHIRELPVEEVHLGGYIQHYWDRKKPMLERASKDAILARFLPSIYKGLLNDWVKIHEHPTLTMYDDLMETYRSQDQGNT
ncbi:hypothetical protein CAC42_6462 [Sphaceloma murrayae]|uniref:Uncharacterized protein n=1 Tax=Sphaceloma murrayae TaxID=2082308 RepID=A0A2K1QMH8_9PEZI|nr:hypothetical protein CAC42_6462 [Sphaceloma murrayae]